MIANFKDFINNVIVESLHPELQQIITSPTTNEAKQNLLANKIKNLTSRGESTGIEGNMPKGSSRAYLKHAEPHPATVDGKQVNLETGTKVAIKADLDKHHNKANHDGMSLGAMQNHAENGDQWVNDRYRVLTHHGDNNFTTNEGGIFPPLIEHSKNHEWSHIGHARNVSSKEFKDITKTSEHPKGISHDDFVRTLNRFHDRNNGKYWASTPEVEKHLNHVESHPLLQKFRDYHGNTGYPPYDYMQIKNMGVYDHPNGSRHIVTRDHGFSTDVMGAYKDARQAQAAKYVRGR